MQGVLFMPRYGDYSIHEVKYKSQVNQQRDRSHIKQYGYSAYYYTEGHKTVNGRKEADCHHGNVEIEEPLAKAERYADNRQSNQWDQLGGSSHEISQQQLERRGEHEWDETNTQDETEQKILKKKALEKDCQLLYSLFEESGQSTYLEAFREKINETYNNFLDSYKCVYLCIQEKNRDNQDLNDQNYSDIKDLKKWLTGLSSAVKVYSKAHKNYLKDFKYQAEVLKRFLQYQNVNDLCDIKQDDIHKIIDTYEFNQQHIEKWIPVLKEFSKHEEHMDAQKLEKLLKDYGQKLERAKRPLDIADSISMLRAYPNNRIN